MSIKVVLLATILAAIAACGDRDASGEPEDTGAQAPAQPAKTVSANSPGTRPAPDTARAAPSDAGPAAVPADRLKALLPERFDGLARVSHDGERAGLGLKMSKARAEYGDQDRRASVMITDLGGVAGLAQMGMELFETEVDNADENGFERTTQYKGHRSYQRMMKRGDHSIGEIMVFVDDRFTVQIDAQNVGWEQMMAALDDIDLEGLQALKKAAN